MGAANGFTTTSPDTRYGAGTENIAKDNALGQKFTAPGSGTLEISEMGAWLAYSSSSEYVKLAIFNYDSTNTCPSTIVSNSQTDAFFITAGTPAKYYHTYGTKPTVTGGADYWLCFIAGTSNIVWSISATGTAVNEWRSATYDTWATDTEWHTHNHYANDSSMYAVYAAAAGGVPLSNPFSRPFEQALGRGGF